VYFFTARSLVNKLHEFESFVSNAKPALIAVVETWFKVDLVDSLLCPKGYIISQREHLVPSNVKGDIAILWEWSNFDPSQNPKPLTNYDETLHNCIRPRDEQKFVPIGRKGAPGEIREI